MENETEVINSTSDEAEVVNAENNDQAEPDVLIDDDMSESVESLVDKNKRLFARAKKAEEELKKLKTQPKPIESKPKQDNQSQPTITESIILEKASLISQGLTIDDIKLLDKLIAIEAVDGKKLSYFEAKEHPLFLANQIRVKEEEKAKKAQLGASHGSTGRQKEVKPMTRDEHITQCKENLEKLQRGELKK